MSHPAHYDRTQLAELACAADAGCVEVCNVYLTGGSFGQGYFEGEQTVGGCAAYYAVWNFIDAGTITECGFDCANIAGQEFSLFFNEADYGEVCNDPDEGDACAANPVDTVACADGLCFSRFSYTGSSCGGGAEYGGLDEEFEANLNCLQAGSFTHCVEKDETNCGYLNGSRVCFGNIPDGDCAFLGDGSMICSASAGAPPAPTDASGMVPATADATLSFGTDQTTINNYNYFTSNTVNTSGTQVSGAGDGAQSPGDVETEGFPDGEVSGGGTCAAAPTCSGNELLCGIIVQEWQSACQDPGTDAEILSDTGLDTFEPTDIENPDVSVGTLDQSGFIADSCLADMVISVGGIFPDVTFPLSEWCDLMTWIGMLVLAGAGLMSARIVVEGI